MKTVVCTCISVCSVTTATPTTMQVDQKRFARPAQHIVKKLAVLINAPFSDECSPRRMTEREIADEQAGFQQGRMTRYQITNLRIPY